MSIQQMFLGVGGGGGDSIVNGLEVISGSETFYIFLQPGSFSISAAKNPAHVLVVGGGGGGGGGIYHGAGGGAGGAVHAPNITLPAGDYTVTIGTGGASNARSYGAGASGLGSNLEGSPLGPLYAQGGGGGAGYNSTSLPGGSGGGSARDSNYPTGAGAPGTQGPYTSTYNSPWGATGYGNPGGNQVPAGGYGSGGGGGAGGSGSSPGSPTSGGPGGPGMAFPSFPGPTLGPVVDPVIPGWSSTVGSGYYAGGGGGSSYGGSGGGGSPGGGGASGWGGTPGKNGTGSGGGAFNPSHYNGSGGAGGHGIVILRFPT